MVSEVDISLRYSGGVSNSFASSSIGGPMSNVVIPNAVAQNLFDHITEASKLAGATDTTTVGTKDYRVFYVKLNNAADAGLQSGILYLDRTQDLSAISYRIALGALNTEITAPGNENTVTPGLTFVTAPPSFGTGLAVPDLAPGDYFGIAMERAITITNDKQFEKGPTIYLQWPTFGVNLGLDFSQAINSGNLALI